ncbi:unnamed protein product, partial [Mesorhabditis spiculigera]
MAMSAGAPSVTATALVAIPAAAMTLVVPAPVVRADANVSVEVVTIAMQALPAVGAVGADSTVAVPAAAVTMSAPAPTVAAHFEAEIPVVAVTMAAPAPVVTATGSAVVAVGVAEMTVSAKAPVVTATSSVVVPVSTIGMSAKVPVVTASSTVVVPSVTVTMSAKDPVVTAINGPSVSAYTTFSKTTGSAVTITLPAANVGDLWVIAMATTSGQMGSTPSGWTKRMGNGAWYDGAYLEVWTRTKVAGDPATITTSASGFSSDSPTEVIAMTVANQAGVNASSSILSDGSTTATPHPTPAITTTVAKAVLIRMVSTGQLSAAHTWPAGVTPVTTVINGTSAALSVAVQTGGAAGSQAAVNATPSNGSKYSSGTIAIAPV